MHEFVFHVTSFLFNLSFSQIEVNPTWRVAVGEESTEVEDQPQREMRVLEAIYPRISSIPQKFVSSLCIVL